MLSLEPTMCLGCFATGDKGADHHKNGCSELALARWVWGHDKHWAKKSLTPLLKGERHQSANCTTPDAPKLQSDTAIDIVGSGKCISNQKKILNPSTDRHTNHCENLLSDSNDPGGLIMDFDNDFIDDDKNKPSSTSYPSALA
jgi:hypothetical protein